MDEISEWFQEVYGYLGFTVTPYIYDPNDFTPIRGVLWKRPNGSMVKTNIRISVELFHDLTSSYHDPLLEYKSLLIDAVNDFLESQNYEKDFKPRKKISKLKL